MSFSEITPDYYHWPGPDQDMRTSDDEGSLGASPEPELRLGGGGWSQPSPAANQRPGSRLVTNQRPEGSPALTGE